MVLADFKSVVSPARPGGGGFDSHPFRQKILYVSSIEGEGRSIIGEHILSRKGEKDDYADFHRSSAQRGRHVRGRMPGSWNSKSRLYGRGSDSQPQGGDETLLGGISANQELNKEFEIYKTSNLPQ